MGIDPRHYKYRPNAIEPEDGYFTKASVIRMQSGEEVERRLGFGRGRLAQGWWLLFLVEMPTPSDFEFRGYTYMSDGIPQGHLPNPPDPRNSEQRLLDGGYDVPRMKNNVIADVFRLSGPDRLAKVVPTLTGNEYPPGSGFPQWKLTRRKFPFRVVEFIAPGKKYTGNYQ